MGVDLFFVLSGYLITRQLLHDSQGGDRVGTGRFYALRAFRILPAYAAVLAIYFLLPSLRETPQIQPFWQFASFTENLLIDYSRDKAFSHVWSLCVEEQFYLLMPLVLAFACQGRTRQRAFAIIAGVALAGLLLRHWSWQAYHAAGPNPPMRLYFEKVYYPGYNRMDGLLAGAGAACIHYFHPKAWTRLLHTPLLLPVSTLLLGGGAWWLFTERLSLSATLWGYPVLALACTSLLMWCCSLDEQLPRFRLPGAALLARLAFSLYLSHKLALCFVKTSLAPHLAGQEVLLALTYVGCILLTGTLLHHGVERPFLRLRDRLLKPSPACP
jgi:peptidoglycan/LPS O-acetylase OafA/YrhL